MADPKLFLPPLVPEESVRRLLADLQLPAPVTVNQLNTIAEYHTIYLIKFPPDATPQLLPAQPNELDGSVSLVLRVSGRHLPHIKTLNEVAAMKWVRENTSIPVPAVVRCDASGDNAIGHEFTLLEKVPGLSVDTIYDNLDDAQKEYLIGQLLGYLEHFRRHEWHHAGGLSLGRNGAIIPGRVLAEQFWQAPEIPDIWGSEESVDSLNPRGPYGNYTSYVQGHMNQYVRNILKHDSLEWMRDLIPRIDALNVYLDQHQTELNRTKYLFTQKDLHFGNVMCDPTTLTITAVLDWEFSVVLPLPLWTPGGGFLWNGKNSAEGIAERNRMYQIFERICEERAPELLADLNVKEQMPHKAVAAVLNHIRAIVEVCPRGQKVKAARKWRIVVQEAMDELGV